MELTPFTVNHECKAKVSSSPVQQTETPRVQLQLAGTTNHPFLQDLLQVLGPIVEQLVPVIIAGLLGKNEPTPATS